MSTGKENEFERTRDQAELEGPDATVDDPRSFSALSRLTSPSDEGVGAVIGPYKLLEELGKGGMGVVWLAEQHEPVHRQVALKIIKAELHGSQVLARFEAERQALAMMDHPNIARVLDAGTTPDGGPFFVMELVKGVTFNRYCDREKLTLRERLELFIPVCNAVQHAHQKGIIHRDLKPSNVLVALYDGKPVPKVIDFGVAKATHQKLTERTMFTEVGRIVGTLEYMSPEQAELSNLDIDTRADIYSLGVMLYELLTGTTPFSSEQLRGAAFDEMLRMIREQEPSRPSTKLASSADLPAVAARRNQEPRSLARLVQGDLDWIVMKCLEKERSRRYDTANQLGQELQRYLADEPVQAGPPAVGYRLKKFLRRNRGPVLAAALLFLTLLAGIIGTTIGLVQAERARSDEADQREIAEDNERKAIDAARTERLAKEEEKQATLKALKAADAERKANGIAQQRLGQIEKANTLLESVFRDIHPRRARKGSLPLLELFSQRLEEVANALDEDAIGDPKTVARLQSLLGAALSSLGNARAAIVILTRARTAQEKLLGADDPDTLTTINRLAAAHRTAGQLKEATDLFGSLYKTHKDKDPDSLDTLMAMYNLGEALLSDGRVAEAFPHLIDAHAELSSRLPADHPIILVCMDCLAEAHRKNGEPAKAIPLFKATLERMKGKLPDNHPDLLTTKDSLAEAYRMTGMVADAIPLYAEILEQRQKTFGPTNPNTLVTLGNLATSYLDSGMIDEAIKLLEPNVENLQVALGPDNADTLTQIINLGRAYRESGRREEAMKIITSAYEKARNRHGPAHRVTLYAMSTLAALYHSGREYDKAIPLYEEVLKKRKIASGPDHPDTLGAMSNLGLAYREAGRPNDAVPLLKEALEKMQATLPPHHRDTLTCMNNLANAYAAIGARKEFALPLLKSALEKSEKSLGRDDVVTLAILANLGVELWREGNRTEALPILEETLKRREAKLGSRHEYTVVSMGNLAVAYRDTRNFSDALPLFERVYAAHKASRHPELLASLENLAYAYLDVKQASKSAPFFQEFIKARRKQLGADDPQFEKLLASVGVDLLNQKEYLAAESFLTESHAIRQKTRPDSWTTFSMKSFLGRCLLEQKKYAEAEPLLKAAYEGMKSREKTIPPGGLNRLTETARILVRLYEAIGNKAEAEKWSKIAATPPAP